MENIEKKLDNLLKLQEIDSKIFELKQVRGALPDEIEDLEMVLGKQVDLDELQSIIRQSKKELRELNIATIEVQFKSQQTENHPPNTSGGGVHV